MKMTLEIDTNDNCSISDAIKAVQSLVPEKKKQELFNESAFRRIFNLDTKGLTPELIADFLDSVKTQFENKKVVEELGKQLFRNARPIQERSNLYNILENIARENFKIRNNAIVRGQHHTITLFRFHKEFCTVRLSIGRQVGHSTLAKQLHDEYKDTSALIVRDRYLTKKDTAIYRENIHHLRGKVFDDFIIIDDASLYSANELNDIYSVLGRHINQTFILLG